MNTAESRRFWQKVNKGQGCWEWQASRTNGYGRFQLNGKSKYAHRLAYEQAVGPVPEGHVVDHLCRNKSCVRPAHLAPATQRANMMREPASVAHINATKIHCVAGHALTGENLRVWVDAEGRPHRICRTCSRQRGLEFRERRRRRGR